MARKSGRNSLGKITRRGLASRDFYRKDKKQLRRRHKFKSHSHRLGLLKKYFLSETGSINPDIKNSSPMYSFSTDIPDNYQESYICALPINPDFLFTYWELPPDYVAKKVNEAKTDQNLFLRIRKKAPLENDQLTDLPEDDAVYPFYGPDKDIKFLINNSVGDMVIEMPNAKDAYIMEIVQKTERGDDILLASHEIIDTFSHNSEANLFSNDDLVAANEYFEDKEGCSQEKNRKDSSMEFDNKSCTGNYNQYLGSASYEN